MYDYGLTVLHMCIILYLKKEGKVNSGECADLIISLLLGRPDVTICDNEFNTPFHLLYYDRYNRFVARDESSGSATNKLNCNASTSTVVFITRLSYSGS